LAEYDVSIKKVEFEKDKKKRDVWIKLTICFPNIKNDADILEGLQKISGITKAYIK
jgi:hypothetical protein